MDLPRKPPIELPRTRASRDPLVDEGLAWVVHLHSGNETPEDWADFDRWKSHDAVHARAAVKAQQLWDKLGPALLEKRRPRTKRLPIIAAFLAAGLLFFLFSMTGDRQALFADYRTSVGENRSVVLRDGSRIELDSGTSFDTADNDRTVTLYSGQIFVSVKPDAAHPFEVRTAGGTIRALGTAFLVRNDGAGVDVAVSESAVQVLHRGQTERIAVGEGAHFSESRPLQRVPRVDLDAALAWRRGELKFWGQPLDTVIREMQRYQRRRLIIVNDTARSLPVTGLFDTRDLDTLLSSLELALPIRVIRLPGVVLIASKG